MRTVFVFSEITIVIKNISPCIHAVIEDGEERRIIMVSLFWFRFAEVIVRRTGVGVRQSTIRELRCTQSARSCRKCSDIKRDRPVCSVYPLINASMAEIISPTQKVKYGRYTSLNFDVFQTRLLTIDETLFYCERPSHRPENIMRTSYNNIYYSV